MSLPIHNAPAGDYPLGCLVPQAFPTHLPRFEDNAVTLKLDEIKAQLAARPGFAAFGRRAQFEPGEWVKDQGDHGSCFPPGTLIRMADGSQKPIEQVRLLDEVLTAEGRTRRVMKTMARPHSGVIYRLKVWGHRHLRMTAEHPVLTKRGYVAAENIKKGDWVAIPRYMPEKSESIIPEEYVPLARTGVKVAKHHSAGLPGRRAKTLTTTPLPPVVRLTAGFGRIVGLFLAEGGTSCGKVAFHFHAKERDTLVADLIELLKTELGISDTVVVVGRGGKPNNCEVKFYGTSWAKFFEAMCATGSGAKRLHPHIASGPREFLEGVLRGWQEGDGLGDPDRCGGCTVSHELAMNMYDIAAALGHQPTVEVARVKINPKHNIKYRRLRYIVAWPSSDNNPCWKRAEQEDGRVWRLVDSTEREPYSGFVYNLEVEDDHSYVAESIGVHNCNGWSCATALEKTRVLRGQEWVKLSGADAYAQMNGGRDQGSALSDGMVVLQKSGIAPASMVTVNQIFEHQISAQAKEARRRFRGFELYAADTEEEFASGILLGFLGVVAVHVTQGYDSLDGEGCPLSGNGPGNHSVHVDDLKLSPSGVILFDSPNNWTTRWGDQGRANYRWNQHLRECVKYHRFFLIRAAADDPGAANPGEVEG